MPLSAYPGGTVSACIPRPRCSWAQTQGSLTLPPPPEPSASPPHTWRLLKESFIDMILREQEEAENTTYHYSVTCLDYAGSSMFEFDFCPTTERGLEITPKKI